MAERRGGGQRQVAIRGATEAPGISGAEFFDRTTSLIDRLGGQAIKRAQDAKNRRAVLEGEQVGFGKTLQLREELEFADQVFNDTALQRFVQQRGEDLHADISRLEEENADSPTGFDASIKALRQGTLGDVDPRARGFLAQKIDTQAAFARTRVVSRHGEKVDVERETGGLISIDTAIRDAGNAWRSTGPAAEAARVQSEVEFELHLAAISDRLTSEQTAAKREEFRKARAFNREIGGLDTAKDKQAYVEKLRGRAVSDLEAGEKDVIVDRMQSDIDADLRRQAAAATVQTNTIKDGLARAKRDAEAGVDFGDQDLQAIFGLVKAGQAAGLEKEAEDVAIAMANQTATRRIMTSSLRDAEQFVDQFNAMPAPDRVTAERQNGATEALKKLRAGLEGPDPTRFARDNGIGAGVPPLAFTDENGKLSPEAFGASLAQREQGRQAQLAVYGRDFSPFDTADMDGLLLVMDQLPSAGKLPYLEQLQDHLGDDASLVYEQMDKNGASLLATAGGKMVERDPIVAGEILRGIDVLANKGATLPLVKDMTISTDDVLHDLYSSPGQAGQRRRVVEAAQAVYAARMAAKGNSATADNDTYEDALRAVTGGVIEWKGSSLWPFGARNHIEAPWPGASEDYVRDFMDGLDGGQLERMAGGGVHGADQDAIAEDIKQSGILISMGKNRYAVQIGTEMLKTRDSDGVDQFEFSFPEP